MSAAKLGLSGTQKVAVVLMNMEQDRAARIMKQFSDAEAEEIAAEIVRLTKVDSLVTERTLTEFHQLATSAPSHQGGRDVATGLLEASFGADRAAGVMSRVESSIGGRPFEFLDTAESAQIVHLIGDEMSPTIALILAHLRPDHASAVLGGFPVEKRIDVAQSIASMGSATPEAVGIVAETLKVRAATVTAPRERVEIVGGVQPLVDIINRSDVATERALLEALDARDPALAEQVRARMVTFADLLRLEARDVQQVLRGIDATQLALVLKGAPDPIDAIIRANLSERNRELLNDEIAALGPVRQIQIEDARAELVRNMRTLLAEGTVSFAEPVEEDDLVA